MDLHSILQNAVSACAVGSLYALYSLGVALIFGVMRLINFAHGELIMLGGYALVALTSLVWPIQFVLVVGVVVLFALAMERAAFRPVRKADPTTLLVTSFAISYLLQNLAILITGSLPKGISISQAVTASFEIGGIVITRLQVFTVVATLVLVAGLSLFLFRTSIGVQMRATAENFDMARLLGIRTTRVIATAFALSGLLAGVAAIALVAQTGTVSPTLGVSAVLVAFIATVLGGIGSLSGAALGGFMLGVVTVVLQATLPADLRPARDAFLFAVVILVLAVRPQGLIVARTAGQREV
jgi:branched-chain amino acid transport system permease protein